jgi:hypothetical protein
MKIRFNENVDLEIVVGTKRNGEPVYETESFLKGETTEIDICDGLQPPFAREIQFGDGDVAFVEENFWKSIDIEIKTL